MPRAYTGPEQLTNNERIVLRMLAISGDNPLTGADFANVAPVSTARSEWAGPILKRLSGFGLVEKTPLKLGNSSTWLLTDAGCEASAARGPDLPELSGAARAALKDICIAIKNRNSMSRAGFVFLGHKDGLADLYFESLIDFEDRRPPMDTVRLTLKGAMIDSAQL